MSPRHHESRNSPFQQAYSPTLLPGSAGVTCGVLLTTDWGPARRSQGRIATTRARSMKSLELVGVDAQLGVQDLAKRPYFELRVRLKRSAQQRLNRFGRETRLGLLRGVPRPETPEECDSLSAVEEQLRRTARRVTAALGQSVGDPAAANTVANVRQSPRLAIRLVADCHPETLQRTRPLLAVPNLTRDRQSRSRSNSDPTCGTTNRFASSKSVWKPNAGCPTRPFNSTSDITSDGPACRSGS